VRSPVSGNRVKHARGDGAAFFVGKSPAESCGKWEAMQKTPGSRAEGVKGSRGHAAEEQGSGHMPLDIDISHVTI
jgi:hypothetical protein